MTIETKVAWWKGNDTPNDSVGSLNGIWYNSYTGFPCPETYINGVVDKAFSFTIFRYTRVPAGSAINFSPTDSFYVQFYFKTADVNESTHLIGKGSVDSSASAEWVISLFSKKIRISTKSNHDPYIDSSTLSIVNDVWIKVKAIYDGVGGWTVYVNDQLVLTGTLFVYFSDIFRDLGIGSDENGNSTFFRYLDIDEVEIYKLINITSLFSIDRSEYTVSFINKSVGTITSYLWNFGDGVTSILDNPVHTYLKDGTYTITLTVYSGIYSDVKTYSLFIPPKSTLTPYSSSKSYTLFVDPKKIPQEFGSDIIRTIESEQAIQQEEENG